MQDEAWTPPDVVELSNGRLKLLGIVESGRVVLVASLDVREAAPLAVAEYGRFGVVQLSLSGWDALAVAAIHAVSRQTASEPLERGSIAARMRIALEALWQPGVPLVFLGDFNAEPMDDELSALHGLHAVTNPLDLTLSPQKYYGREVVKLFNPMLAAMNDAKNTPTRGTFYFNASRSGSPWRCYDHIIVSREVSSSIASGPRILTSLTVNGAGDGSIHRLVTAGGRPSRRFSDHLPVEMRLR